MDAQARQAAALKEQEDKFADQLNIQK